MALSIRKYLLIHLLCGITVIIAITTIANYYLDEKAIGVYLDNWLTQSAINFQAIIGNDIKNHDLKTMQKLLDDITTRINIEGQQVNPIKLHARDKFQFQIWNERGELLLRSTYAPKIALSHGKIGFSNQFSGNQPWRVFTQYSAETGLTVVVAERLDIRNELGHHIARDSLYILLLTCPLLGFVIWFIVGKGLFTIWRIASEVGHRAVNYLDPVDIQSVPLEIKPLIDELNKLFLRLRQGFEREKSFSANAAHELRTPLAALKTQAQVALKAVDAKERETALTKLIASVDRSSHIVQQLLTLSRIVPETALQDMTTFNLSKLATEIVASIAPQAIDKNIEIDLVGGDERIAITGFVTATSILLRNLIDNAIRYTPENGAVHVRIEDHGARVLARVIDNGPGVPPELRSQVFERFYRVLGTKSPGSGLGLAIVQQIAALHQATVTLGTPDCGQGLEVTVDFPKTIVR